MRGLVCLSVAIAAVLSTPALAAARECPAGSSAEPVQIVSWVASRSDRMVVGDFVLRNNLQDSIRMIDASVFFDDALGNHIGGIKFTPDVTLPAMTETPLKDRSIGFDRVADARPEDVAVIFCTKSVIFQDGSTQTF